MTKLGKDLFVGVDNGANGSIFVDVDQVGVVVESVLSRVWDCTLYRQGDHDSKQYLKT